MEVDIPSTVMISPTRKIPPRPPQGAAPTPGLTSNGQNWTVAFACSALGVFSLLQLLAGADVLVLVLSVSSIAIGFYPLIFVGRDLYTVLAALFCFRYTGGALLAKTLYWQPLDSHLYGPVSAYALANLYVATVVGVLLLMRRFDRGKTVLPTLTGAGEIRKVGSIAYAIGIGAGLLAGAALNRESNVANTGALHVISSALINLIYLGYAAEVVSTFVISNGRKLISSRLVLMLALAVAMALFLNVRSLIVNAGVCVFLCGFLLRAIRVRHLVSGAALFLVFATWISPIALELRTLKEGKSGGQYASDVLDVVTKALTNPTFLAEVQARENFRQRYESGIPQYDYFGDNSNIANRLSFVALVDTIYYQKNVAGEIGFRGMTEVYERVVPRFLASKEERPFGYGDWLSWELGLIDQGRIAFLSFPLPLEGLALFGIPGLILFPVVFMCPVLLIMGRIASLRYATAPSLFLVSALHWELVEGASDTYISMVMRSFPLLMIPVWLLFWAWAQQRPSEATRRLEQNRRARAGGTRPPRPFIHRVPE